MRVRYRGYSGQSCRQARGSGELTRARAPRLRITCEREAFCVCVCVCVCVRECVYVCVCACVKVGGFSNAIVERRVDEKAANLLGVGGHVCSWVPETTIAFP